MNNERELIEKLAKEHGSVSSGLQDCLIEKGAILFETSEQLVAFAQAYARATLQTKPVYEVAINGSWLDTTLAEYVKHKGIKRTLFTLPPSTVQSSEPVAKVLFRQDEDGLEPISFYSNDEAPAQEKLKDRFVILDVHLTPPSTVPVEKYNKLIETLIRAKTRFSLLAANDDTIRNGVVPSVGAEDIEQAIAEAERKVICTHL